MSSEIRREAEALWDQLKSGDPIEHIEAFAKAQRVKEVEAIAQELLDRITASAVNKTHALDVSDYLAWLTQRKKELQP